MFWSLWYLAFRCLLQLVLLRPRSEGFKRGTCAADRWPTSGHLGRSSFSGDYRLRPAPCGDFRPIPARDLRGMPRSRRSLCQIHMLICRSFTGATGLEPATSGVTGRSWCFRAERGYAGIPGESRDFRPRCCGDWRVRAGASASLVRDQRGMSSCRYGEQSGMCGDPVELDSATIRREAWWPGRVCGRISCCSGPGCCPPWQGSAWTSSEIRSSIALPPFTARVYDRAGWRSERPGATRPSTLLTPEIGRALIDASFRPKRRNGGDP